MPIKDTSLLAFWQEKTGLRLQPKQAKILDDLCVHGPATRTELVSRTGMTINCVCGRVRALLDAGLIEEYGKVDDQATHKQVWKLRLKEDKAR